jgi:hypothetical protein
MGGKQHAGAAIGVGRYFTETIGGFAHELGRALAHGVTQGALAAAQGGRFGAGFLAASFSSAWGSSGIGQGGNRLSRVAVAAVVGGTASRIGGGKFANGAVTGAFVQALNHDGDHAENAPKKTAGSERVGDPRTEIRSVPIMDALGVPSLADVPVVGGADDSIVKRFGKQLLRNVGNIRDGLNASLTLDYQVRVETRAYFEDTTVRSFSREGLSTGGSSVTVQDSTIRTGHRIANVVTDSQVVGISRRSIASQLNAVSPQCVELLSSC